MNQVLQWTLKSLFIPIGLIGLTSFVLLPILFLGRTDVEPSLIVQSEVQSPISKLARAALYRIGYYRITLRITEDEEGEEFKQPIFEKIDQNRLDICSPAAAITGIVTAEAYLRPKWRRDLELTLGQSIAALTGRRPDWSYGIAQIRLSTAQDALSKGIEQIADVVGPFPPHDSNSLLRAITESDECEAFAAAALIADPSLQFDDPIAVIASRYRGGLSRADLPGVVSYEDFVAEIARMAGGGTRGYTGENQGIIVRRKENSSAISTVNPLPTTEVHPSKHETDLEGLQPILCIERGFSSPFAITAAFLPSELVPTSNGRGYYTTVDPTELRESFSKLDVAAHDLLIRYRTSGTEPADRPLRMLGENGLVFGPVFDLISLKNVLTKMSLSVDRNWNRVALVDVGAGPFDQGIDCSVEVAISPPKPKLFRELVIQSQTF